MSRNIVNKVVGFNPETATAHNTAITSADCYPLLGSIYPEGTAPAGTSPTQIRSLDRIKPKRLKVKGMISLNFGYQPNTFQNIYVRILILSQKDIKNSGSVTGSVDSAHLLEAAAPGTANDQVPFKGNTQELLYPVNTNKFTVYMDKIIKLDSANTYITGGWTGPMPSYSKRWSYTFKESKMPKHLLFDAGSGNNVNNFAPFVCLGYAYPDGTAPDAATTLRVVHSVHSELQFEDA